MNEHDFVRKENVRKRRVIEADGTRITDEDMATDEMDGYTAVPFEMIMEKHSVTAEPCWGCLNYFRKPTVPGDNLAVDRLWATKTKNEGTMHKKALAHLIHEEWMICVYAPAMELGKECIPWPEKVILRHLEGRHGVSRSAELDQSIVGLSSVEREILNNMFMHKDGVNGFKFDDKRVKSLCEVVKTKHLLVSALKES